MRFRQRRDVPAVELARRSSDDRMSNLPRQTPGPINVAAQQRQRGCIDAGKRIAFDCVGGEIMISGARYVCGRLQRVRRATECILQQSPAKARDIRPKRGGCRRICRGSFEERQCRVIGASPSMRKCSPVEQLAIAGAFLDRVAKRIARVPWRAAVEVLANRDD
jgi:hypothetical protein